jgi:hypothetical protein
MLVDVKVSPVDFARRLVNPCDAWLSHSSLRQKLCLFPIRYSYRCLSWPWYRKVPLVVLLWFSRCKHAQ